MRKVSTLGIVLAVVLLSVCAAKLEDKKNDCARHKNDPTCLKKLNDEHQNDEQDKNSQPIDDSLQQLSDELLDDEVGSYEEDDEAVTEPTNKQTTVDLPPCLINKPPTGSYEDEDPDVVEDQVDEIDYPEREIKPDLEAGFKVEVENGIPLPEVDVIPEIGQPLSTKQVQQVNGLQVQGSNNQQFQMPPFGSFEPFNKLSPQSPEPFPQDFKVRQTLEQQKFMNQMARQQQLMNLKFMEQQRRQQEAQQEMSRIFETQRQQRVAALRSQKLDDISRQQMDRQRGDILQQPTPNFGSIDSSNPFLYFTREQSQQQPRNMNQFQQGDGFRRFRGTPRSRSNKFEEIEEALFTKREELMLERQRIIDEQRARSEQVDARRRIWRRS